MQLLGRDIWSFTGHSPELKRYPQRDVRALPPARVDTFQELATRVAALSFRNPEYVLFFRGQARDYSNSAGLSSLYPSIFRSETKKLELPLFEKRLQDLGVAEKALVASFKFDGARRIRRHQLLRWAVLQHYVVCRTPLLDVTPSLRVACSIPEQANGHRVMLYILGLPQISGSVTSSSEHGLQ